MADDNPKSHNWLVAIDPKSHNWLVAIDHKSHNCHNWLVAIDPKAIHNDHSTLVGHDDNDDSHDYHLESLVALASFHIDHHPEDDHHLSVVDPTSVQHSCYM